MSKIPVDPPGDIAFYRDQVRKAWKQTDDYGPMLPAPFAFLDHVLDMLEEAKMDSARMDYLDGMDAIENQYYKSRFYIRERGSEKHKYVTAKSMREAIDKARGKA